MKITFNVPAVPVAQPRQRHFIHSGSGRLCNAVKAKHPVHAFKASVRMACERVYTSAPLDCPLRLVAVFVLPRPSRLIWRSRPMPRVLHTSKPDLDNLAKAVKDALSGLLWRDDAQVAVSIMRKYYAAGDEQPHVEIELTEAVCILETA